MEKPKMCFVFGRAGAGKSTFCREAKTTINAAHYSIDYRFIGGSDYRKSLLSNKTKNGFQSLRDASNQMNWYDWGKIEEDIKALLEGKSLWFAGYNRDTGKDEEIVINPANEVLCEGVLLVPHLFHYFDKFLYIHTPDTIRLARLLEKDKSRRTQKETLARFLLCDYSESMFYKGASFQELLNSGSVSFVGTTIYEFQKSQKQESAFIPVEVFL